ncbi:MAG: IS200/IS605 family transposase [bacterium]|nr:IS200/IS605 family transposase [bacterium]
MPYWRLHYHAVWACKERQSLITPDLEPDLYKYILGKGIELGGIMHAVGGVEEHLHTTFSLAPKYALADFIGKLKGASSHWVTHVLKHPNPFDWQRGYGVVSFGDRNMAQVIHYVRNQKEHHHRQTTNIILEKWSEDDDGVVLVWDDSNPPRPEGRG